MSVAQALIGTALLTLSAATVAADAELRVPVPARAMAASQDLGSVTVPGIGTVRVEARRHDKTVTLFALGPDDRLLGQSETVVGLGRALLVVKAPDGLREIEVLWDAR